MSQIRYLTDNIDELDAAEHDLEVNGIPRSNIHILSNNESELRKHNLPSFSEWSKRDIVSYGLKGAALGALLCVILLGAGVFLDLNDSIGWAVLGFIAAMTMGFCTWEGGLMGIENLNQNFMQYKEALEKGEHLLVVEVENSDQETAARYSVESHEKLRAVS